MRQMHLGDTPHPQQGQHTSCVKNRTALDSLTGWPLVLSLEQALAPSFVRLMPLGAFVPFQPLML
jgi:hypothetical protein